MTGHAHRISPLFVRGGGVGSARVSENLRFFLSSPTNATFDPRRAKFVVSDTHSVYTHCAFQVGQPLLPLKAVRLLNGSGKREETRVDVCFLKFVHALFRSRFVPRVILREIEVWGRR